MSLQPPKASRIVYDVGDWVFDLVCYLTKKIIIGDYRFLVGGVRLI